MKVELQNLTKIFPSRNKKSNEEVIAVNDFTFTIPDGKLIGLLGPSGCGKSTTLYMISGLQKPSSGHIFFGEEDVTELTPENRGVGLVFQNYALYPHMTVKQNIMFPLQNLKGADRLTKQEMLDKTVEAAKLVQIDDLLDRKPSELSGGQQQRVAIARALVKLPKVLLLDEPLSNLDARLRLQTREEIRRIQRETGITTIFVTHDQEEAMSISDMIVVMKKGVLQQIGEPQKVYDDPANLFVAKFLGTPPINVFSGYVKDEKLYIGKVTPITEIVSEEAAVEENVITEEEATDANKKSKKKPKKNKKKDIVEEAAKVTERVIGYNCEGGECVMDVPGVADQPVTVGIRPEGFIPDDNGSFTCDLNSVEVMGRDVSIVSHNEASLNPSIRSIVDADCKINAAAKVIRYNLKPHKVFLFNYTDETRIRFEVK